MCLDRNASRLGAAAQVPPIVDEVLRAPAQPMDSATRAYMELLFDRDFSHVRIHSDDHAAAAARAVYARAYAVGDDLVFGGGEFSPHSAKGRKLLAHELAHVVQPRAGSSAPISQPGDASEREADSAADIVAAGGSARVSTAGATIQREPLDVQGSEKLLENASPMLASAVGSTTLDEFDTGKADLKPTHKKELVDTTRNILVLMVQYPLSTITVTGYADTVGTKAKNLALGESRATAVKQALVDLGISEAMVATDSKGEGLPQAVKTKDETPNAKNRRVEMRFYPKRFNLPSTVPKLAPPSPATTWSDQYDPRGKPPIDLRYHPKIEPNDPTKAPPNLWQPLPPLPKGSEPQSALDLIGKKILDPIIDAVAGKLSESVRDKLKEGARDAVKAGLAKGARAAAQAAGVSDSNALDAIEKAAEAAIQEKGKSQP